MKTQNFFSAWFTNDLDEIIFERRNKSYGAYELRKHYPQRLQAAFLITILFFSSIWLTMEIITAKNKFKEVFAPAVFPPSVEYPKYLIETATPDAKPEMVTPEKKDILSTLIVKDSLKHEPLDIDTSITKETEDFKTGKENGLGSESSIPGTGMNSGDGSGEGKSIDSVKGEFDREEVMLTPAIMPAFPGGINGLSKYLQKHLHCSQFRQSNAKSGKMYLSFIVSREGKVHSIEVIRDGVGFGCAEEAVKVIQNMPPWTPGSNNNRTVNVKMIIPISMQTDIE